MKAVSYKMKNVGSLFVESKRWRPDFIQNRSYFYKKNVKYRQKSKISFFCEKPVSKPVNS